MAKFFEPTYTDYTEHTRIIERPSEKNKHVYVIRVWNKHYAMSYFVTEECARDVHDLLFKNILSNLNDIDERARVLAYIAAPLPKDPPIILGPIEYAVHYQPSPPIRKNHRYPSILD